MKISTEVSSLKIHSIERIGGPALKEKIRLRWLGIQDSIYSYHGLKLLNGVIAVQREEELHAKPFFLWVNLTYYEAHVVSVIVYTDSFQLKCENGVEVEANDMPYLAVIAKDIVAQNEEYAAIARKWEQEKPWLSLIGLTPEQAIQRLTDLGY